MPATRFAGAVAVVVPASRRALRRTEWISLKPAVPSGPFGCGGAACLLTGGDGRRLSAEPLGSPTSESDAELPVGEPVSGVLTAERKGVESAVPVKVCNEEPSPFERMSRADWKATNFGENWRSMADISLFRDRTPHPRIKTAHPVVEHVSSRSTAR